MTLRFSGQMAIYFNRHGAAPRVWCVAADGWELAVVTICMADVNLLTEYRPKETPDDEDGLPSAYLVVCGDLEVDQHGHAFIAPQTTERITREIVRIPRGATVSERAFEDTGPAFIEAEAG